ncbi:hypothetical protein pipiens_009083 [Culex pipiens pipiens]|uniref:Uncharacterized protein n=1 Tax=Culex pipiens pipiens TaxID=38569 RepID=A0ABD1DF60_CULPP
MSTKNALNLSKAEQDRQTVQTRYEKMKTDYAKGLSAFDKDLKARLEAAEQRRLAALKQKVPMAHKCPTTGECQECEEKQRKLKATMKAMSKAQPKAAFKKKTLNRQLSRSADDVSLILTEEHSMKASSHQYARGGGKDTMVQKSIKSAKFSVKNTGGHEDSIVTKVASSIAEWMGIKGKPAEPAAPALPPAGTAKDAICSTPASNAVKIVPAAPIQPRDGYVKDTAAHYLKISEAQSASSITPKGSPSMSEVIMPRTLNGKMTVTMQQSATARQGASTVVTKKGTTKDTSMGDRYGRRRSRGVRGMKC